MITRKLHSIFFPFVMRQMLYMKIEGGIVMTEKVILSEKLEDNKAAAEWGMKQAELIKKSEEITQRLVKKYTPMILSRKYERNS